MLKKIIYVIVVLFVILSGIFVPNSRVNATALNEPFVGSLVDENFSFLYNATDGSGYLASGWDIDKKGGNIVCSYNQWFKVVDTSSTYPVTMTKKIDSSSSGKIVLETRFKPTSSIDGITFSLNNGATKAVKIATYNGNICYVNSSGLNIVLKSYIANQEYGLKVIADITNKYMDIYVNGVRYAQGIPFTSAVSSIDSVFISSGDISTGEFYVSTIKIYKGYAVWERFISSIPNFFPTSEWQITGTGGTANIQKMLCATEPDTYSLVLNDTSTTQNITASKQFDNITDNVVFEYKFYMPVLTNTKVATISNNDTSAFEIYTKSGYICYSDGANNLTNIVEVRQNLWYHIKIVVKLSQNTVDIYVNGKLKLTNIALKNNVTSLNKISFSSSVDGTGIIWLDDILVYNKLAEPTDYVPQPQPVSSSSTVIGIQNCSMWREGSHLGWDRINGYPERKPYLGFYDEGSPEVADWEIKWLVEHGVNYQMYCWFRPALGTNNPIKDPYLDYGLHDGFFNAKYSNYMKFAIMWENAASRAQDSADFRNNIVPYWVEYYLKDPRYLVINNKPVISFYSLEKLKRDFLTYDGIKAEMDYLRSVCKSLGYDDAILMTTNSGSNTTDIANIKASGLDCIYSYSWGTLCGNIDLQKLKMTEQKSLGIDLIPTISMGRQDEAWGGVSGKYASPNDYQMLTEWVKNTFVPTLPTGSVGANMIMLDNWNEFGEGHFMVPTEVFGFNYLDVIRNVYTGVVSHTDAIPTENQKSRVNVLYPQDRVVTVPQAIKKPIEIYKSKVWNFNTAGNTEGWVLSASVSGLASSGGYLNGNATTEDPSIQTADNLNIDVTNSNFIVVKMKNSTNSILAQIFFQVQGDTGFLESKSVQFIVNANDSNYSEYVIEMSKNSNWKGIIKRLRLDPCGAIGNFSIDYIGITSDAFIKAGANLIANSSFEESGEPTNYAAKTQISNKDFRTGYKSLSVTKIDSTYASIQYPITAIQNKQSFYYSVWAKLPPNAVAGTTNGKCFTLCIEYTVNGVKKQKGVGQSQQLSSTTWVQLSGVYTIDEVGTVINPKIYMFSDSPPMLDTIYYDDIEVRPLSVELTTAPENQATNVLINSKIDISFNVDMDTSSFIASNMLLNGSSDLIKSVSNNVLNRGYTIELKQNLENNKVYNLILKNIKTLDGQALPYVTIVFTAGPQFIVADRKFYLNFGQANQTDLLNISNANGIVGTTANFTNNTPIAVNATIAISLYENNSLKEVNTATYSVDPFKTTLLSSALDVSTSTKNKYVLKQILVDSFGNVKPYTNFAELK